MLHANAGDELISAEGSSTTGCGKCASLGQAAAGGGGGGRGVLRPAEAPQCVQATLSSHEHHERSDGAGEAERRQRWETRRSSG